MRIEEIRRGDLAERLGERRGESEQTILARVSSVSDPEEVRDPEYVTGLRAAVSAALAYAIAALGSDAPRPAPVPAEVVVQEAEAAGGARGACLQEALRSAAASLGHLIGAVAAEYRSESEAKARSLHQRRRERVHKLLAGELSDGGELDYDLEGHHLGLVATGPGSEQALRELAASLDRHPLIVRHRIETAWAWLGGTRELTPEQLEALDGWSWPAGVRVAIGEPGRELAGWRLTHRQAAAALPVAERGSKRQVR